MGKSFQQAPGLIRKAQVARDLGTRLEIVAKYFLRNDLYWSKRLENVLLWSESPYHKGRRTAASS